MGPGRHAMIWTMAIIICSATTMAAAALNSFLSDALAVSHNSELRHVSGFQKPAEVQPLHCNPSVQHSTCTSPHRYQSHAVIPEAMPHCASSQDPDRPGPWWRWLPQLWLLASPHHNPPNTTITRSLLFRSNALHVICLTLICLTL